MVFMEKEMQPKDAKELRFGINSYFKDERIVNEMIETHLSRIEDYVEPSAILNYLYRHEFIGYINYALVKEVQEVVKSRLLDKHIEEYEKDYQSFLQLALKDIHAAFKKCPDLEPNYPVGLPKLTIHLESDWDGRSMYEWKELFERRFTWPKKLNIVKISENCIIITCAVWPKFAEDVLRDLTDPKVIADLKKEGVTIDISPQLLAYHPSNASTTEEVCSDLEEQLRIEQLVIDEFGEGMLTIKPDWDRQTATSGLGTMPDSSDKQTTTTGDGGEECRLVELQTELTLQETIETYERAWRERKTAYEHLMTKVLREKESFEEKFISETKMRKAVVMELEQIKESYQKAPSHLQAMLTEREEELESVKKQLERINKGHHAKSLQIKSVLNVQNVQKEVIKAMKQRIKDLTMKPKLSNEEQQRLNESLLKAAEDGDKNRVKSLLNSGADIDCTDESKQTPLHHASRRGNVEVVKLLLTHGTTVGPVGKFNQTPLHYASSRDNVEVVKLLLTHGATVDSVDEYGHTPLHLALLENHPSTALLLISAGADVYLKDKRGQSAVMIAAVFDYKEVLEQLQSLGVSTDTLQNYHLPPGWKAEVLGMFFDSYIQYTNSSSGLQQQHHPNCPSDRPAY